MDGEVAQIWQQVQERVLRMANKDSSILKKDLDIDSLLLYLDRAQQADQKESESSRKVRAAFNGTLTCIQTIGGVIAEVAANAYPPATLCFNALGMVIEAWKGCEGVFEDLASLLERCTEFLTRLSHYTKTKMDASLRKVACQHLSFFVEICDRILELRKKHKIKIFMRQLFLKDDSIKDALNRMENLYKEEVGLVAAQTFRISSETAADAKDNLHLTEYANTKLDTLLNDKNQQKRMKDDQKEKETIMKALGFDDKTIDADDKKDEPWEILRKHETKRIEGSGKWVQEDPFFRDWVKGTVSAKPILGVEGRDGAGKTLVASNIIAYLRELRSIGGSGPRLVVAHYFLGQQSKGSVDKDALANEVSRSLLWQLAKADEHFKKSTLDICNKRNFLRNSVDMWRRLVFEIDRDKMDSTFFIVIDGLTEGIDALSETFKTISVEPNRHRVRLLITGKENFLDNLTNAAGIEIDRIKLGKSNMQDIELYIQSRMDDIETLKDKNNHDVAEIRERILHTLKESTDGDYYKLGQDLNNLAEYDEVEDIEKYLKNPGQTRPDHILALIDKLNQERTPKEIADINEIILWVSYGPRWLLLSEMEAALALRTRKWGSRSLTSLESKIRSRYSIFRIDDQRAVRFDPAEISEMIPAKKRSAGGIDSHEGANEILPAEIKLVKHYLSTVCPGDVYDKFGFDQFFELKMARKSHHICIDQDNAHITLALRCLTFLTEQRTSKTEALHGYTKEHLHSHLKATDLSLADRELKTEVGVLLEKLFTDEYASNSLFRIISNANLDTDDFIATFTPLCWMYWVFSNSGVNVIDQWLKDSAVIEKIRNSEWVKRFTSADSDRHKILFEVACRAAASRLFQEETIRRSMMYEFVFLAGFLTKANEKPPEWDDDTEYLQDLYHPTLELIQLVEDWSQESLGIKDKDSRWEAQVATLLFHLSNEDVPKVTAKDAEWRARKALELDRNNWCASYTLAQTTGSLHESIELLESLIGRLAKDVEWLEKEGHKITLAEIMISLGDKLWSSSDKPEAAIAMYSKSLESARTERMVECYYGILERYKERRLWPAVVSFLTILLNGSSEEATDGGYLLDPPNFNNAWSFYFELLVPTFQATGRWDLLDDLYDRALRRKMDAGNTCMIRYLYGCSFRYRDNKADSALLIWEELLLEAVNPFEAKDRCLAMNYITSATLPFFISKAFPANDMEGKPILVKEYCDKVEAFHRVFSTWTDREVNARIAYARYFHLRGDDTQSRQLLKEIVAQRLEMLSDDELDNDSPSYWELGQVFATMDDEPNALVAWELLAQAKEAIFEEDLKKRHETNTAENAINSPTEVTGRDIAKGDDVTSEDQDTPDEQKKGETESSSPNSRDIAEPLESTPSPATKEDEEDTKHQMVAVAFCDNCGHIFLYASEMWTCADEGGCVQFDDECFRKLKDGKLENPALCDKNHRHYYVGKRDEEKMAQVPPGSVLLGDEIITCDDWKRRVRTAYVEFANQKPAMSQLGVAVT